MDTKVPRPPLVAGMAAEGLAILYEDNHIIAVVKPAGVLSQGDLPAGRQVKQDTMLERVKQHLKEKYKKPGNVFLGLVHRLDRPVSGIILFAKTSKGASRLSEQFRNHTIEKTYHALVSGKPARQKGMLTHFLIKDKKLKKALRRTAPQGKLQESYLYYEIIKSNNKYSLLKVTIDTGKFHQIRSQLSMAGFPIVGDVKYGGQTWEQEGTIALCATELSFKKATEDLSLPVSPQRDGVQGRENYPRSGNSRPRAREMVHPVKYREAVISQDAKLFNRVNLKIDIPKEWHKYL